MKEKERNLQISSRSQEIVTWIRLARIFQKVDAASARNFRSAALSTGQFDVLVHLGAHEGVCQQELADSLLVTKGNISQLLERMENRGLVVRYRKGRTKYLRLSTIGLQLYRSIVPSQESLLRTLFSCLSAEEQKILAALLRKIDRGIRKPAEMPATLPGGRRS